MAVTEEKFKQIQEGLLGTGELPERIPDEDIGLPRVVGTVPRPRTIKETFDTPKDYRYPFLGKG